jgi:predicted regulator of Ras-like GTPase activity (Roadblock/LC7/MglB family)
MMAAADPSAMVKDLQARVSAIGSALISRNGLVLWGELPSGMYAETFGVMCATIFGAAATANHELGRTLPENIGIAGGDSTMIITPCGAKAILVVVLDREADPRRALDVVAKFATALASG